MGTFFTVTVADQLLLVAHVVWAMVLGGLIGFERQHFAKPAGLRTHTLVAGAACLITGITADLALSAVSGDPTRGIHAIITGIGFLGGGSILRQRDVNPSGLTTAATILYTASVGCAVAVGYGLAATAATVLAIAALVILGRGRKAAV